jgi:hypothetical protein
MSVNEQLDLSEVYMYANTLDTFDPVTLTVMPIPRSGHVLRAIAVVRANMDAICAIKFRLGFVSLVNQIDIPADAVIGDIHSITFSENPLTACKVSQDGDIDADRSSLAIISNGGGTVGSIHITIVVGK